MFFRMLRHELREKKGLNLILFLFITAASALVFISAVQMYSSITGVKRSCEGCKISDCAFLRIVGAADHDRTEIIKKLEQQDEILSYHFEECLRLSDQTVDFANFDESESSMFQEKLFSLSKQPRTVNILYGLKDEPFYIRNGTAGISREVQLQTGAEPGDELRITTPIGNVYSFEIAQIFKAPCGIKEDYILISDADYDALRQEFPVRWDICELQMQNPEPIAMRDVFMRLYSQPNEPDGFQNIQIYSSDYSEQIFSGLVAGFMVFASIFMILLIFMTIRFIIIASLKEEEKSIGTMRALGVDSFRFRWLIAAKFIAFSAAGGILGIAAGFPFSKQVILKFSPNLLNPPDAMLLLIGAAAVAGIASVMILFTMSVMRRINRISVIDAIHGENRGERFRKSSVLQLRCCKRMPVPLFLAASDILTRLKRYVFLILSYALGAAIVLLIVDLRCSVVSEDFLKYNLTGNVDFALRLSEEQYQVYNERTAYDGIPLMEQINTELKEAGIPASAKTYMDQSVTVHFGSIDVGRFSCYSSFEEMDLLMLSDGTAPELANECAVSRCTADAFGIGVGSVLEIGMLTIAYEDGSLSETESREQFVVTGLFDYMEQGVPVVVTGRQYQPKDTNQGYSRWSSFNIDSDDKEAVMQQLRDFYGADHVLTTREYISDYLWKYELILTTMMYVISGAVLVITVLITVLYLNVFLAEDMPEIALLKALGFSEGAVYALQLLRMLLLTAFSIAAGVLLTKTLGLQLLRVIFRMHVGLTGFVFVPMPFFTYVLLPLMYAAAVLIPSVIRLLHVRSVDIRELNEE